MWFKQVCFFWSVPQSVSSRKLENDQNHWDSQSVGGKEEGCWCVWGCQSGGVNAASGQTPRELICWGCVLWEGKCRIAGPDSKHCCVPSMSFIGHEAGGKAGDCTGNVKSKFCGKEVGDGNWCHYSFLLTSHPVNFHWPSMGKTCSRSCTSTGLLFDIKTFSSILLGIGQVSHVKKKSVNLIKVSSISFQNAHQGRWYLGPY